MGNESKIPTVNSFNLKSPLAKNSLGTIDKTTIEKWGKSLGARPPMQLDGSKVKTEIEKGGKQAKISLDAIPTNKQNVQAKQNAQDCPHFCRKPGFAILPVRYGVALDTKKTLPANLGENVTNIKLIKHKYVAEMISSGYVYLYYKRAGVNEWKAYIANKSGYYQEFKLDSAPPLAAKDFACQSAGHSTKASLIVVPENKPNEIKEVYIIYTHAPLTKAKREEFSKNANAFVSKGYWQKIDISQWRGGGSQKHCFTLGNLVQINEINKSFGATKWQSITKLFQEKPKEYCAIALYDAVGITRKLNDDRNIKAFGNTQTFLEKKENGITTQHRMQTLNIIENLKDTITNNYISVRSEQVKFRNQEISTHSALDLRRQAALEAAKKAKDYSRVAQLEREIALTNKNRSINERNELDGISKAGKLKGDESWKKYQKQLDMEGVRAFKNKVDQMSLEAFNKAKEYEADHLNWLKSKNLLNNLYAFDQNEILAAGKLPEGSNGFIFHTIIMDFMYGMTFLTNGQNIINEWMNEKNIKNENLYLRAYCFNNKNLIENYNNTFTSENTGKTAVGNFKKIVGAFKSADEAFDKWLISIEGKQFILSHEFKAADKLFYWMSLGLNSLFSAFSKLQTKTINVGSITAVATEASRQHAVQLYYLRSGELANKIPLNSLFFNLDFKKAAESAVLKNEKYKNPWILSVGKEVDLVVKQQPKITQNRILAIVGIIELLNFYFQYGAWKKDTLNNPEYAVALTGSLFSLTSVSFKLIGENAAGLNVGEKAAAHMKITAASFGVLAGVAGLIIDGEKFKSANSLSLKFLYGFRFLASLGILIGQVGHLLVSLSSTYAFMQKQGIQKVVIGFTKNVVVAWLMSARVVAGLNIFTVSLIVLEMALRKWVLDDAMEDWCQKSAFRKKASSEKPFQNDDDEFKGFSEAIVSVI